MLACPERRTRYAPRGQELWSFLSLEAQDTVFVDKLGYTRKRINPGEGIGLRNCFERLKLFFGERCRMEIRSREGKGTTITLSIKDVETRERTSGLEESLKTP